MPQWEEITKFKSVKLVKPKMGAEAASASQPGCSSAPGTACEGPDEGMGATAEVGSGPGAATEQ